MHPGRGTKFYKYIQPRENEGNRSTDDFIKRMQCTYVYTT